MSKKLLLFIVLILTMIPVSHTYIPDPGNISPSYPVNHHQIDNYLGEFYSALKSEVPKPEYEVFKKALTGFFNLKADNRIKKNLLTIIDFSLSSNLERMWIVDINRMKVIHYGLVAHGRNSGEEFARHFSNISSSWQSSLGFYLTDGIYWGKHGMSLYLDGLEPGVNDKARARTIVMHSADYVSKEFIRNFGRLGRSFGCPSIPLDNHKEIITMLSGRSCLYIHYPDEEYHAGSRMLTRETAMSGLIRYLNNNPGMSERLPGLSGQIFITDLHKGVVSAPGQ